MKTLRYWVIAASAVLCISASSLVRADDSPIAPERVLSAKEAIHVLDSVIARYLSIGQRSKDAVLLTEARALFVEAAKGGPDAQQKLTDARSAVSLFFTLYDKSVQELMAGKFNGVHRDAIVDFGIRKNPKAVARQLGQILRGMGGVGYEAALAAMDRSHVGWYEANRRYWNVGDMDGRMTAAAESLDASLTDLASHLFKHADHATLRRFRRDAQLLQSDYTYAVEAIANRSAAASIHVRLIRQLVDEFKAGGRLRVGSRLSVELENLITAQEDREGHQDAWINEQTVVAGVASAITIASLGTLGPEAAAATATVETIAADGTVLLTEVAAQQTARQVAATFFREGVRAGNRVFTVALSSAQISDLIRAQGVAAVGTIPFWINVTAALAAFPRPGLALAAKSQIALFVERLQYKAGIYSVVMGTAYCGDLMWHADSIARDFGNAGQSVSAADVRNQGISACLAGMLGGLSHQQYFRQNIATSPELENLIKHDMGIRKWFVTNYLSLRNSLLLPPTYDAWMNARALLGKKAISPTETPYKGVGTPSSPLVGKPISPLKGLGVSVGRMANSALFIGATAMMGLSYFDFAFENDVGAPPKLGPGEIAIVANGFNTSDILYYGFHYALRRERERYIEGKNFFVFDFKTPKELVYKIGLYAKQYGRIRYLKIEGHGHPGYLLNTINGDYKEGINPEWLDKNGNNVLKVTRKAMAPDAEIVMISCLLGGNLKADYNLPGGGGEADDLMPKKRADEFIRRFGPTFLPNGGTLHTSRRFIMGTDAIGAAFDYAMHATIPNRARADQMIQVVLDESARLRDDATRSPKLASELRSITHDLERVTYGGPQAKITPKALFSRIYGMIERLAAIDIGVGWNVDAKINPWGKESHRIDTFPAH